MIPSHKPQRGPSIDQTKICLYLGQERIMANVVRFATADNWNKVP